MIVTISEYLTNPPLQLSATDELEIRGWYNRDFIAGDGITPVEANFTNGQSGPYYLTFPTLTAAGLLVPAHDVQATTESSPTAGYIEQLWVNGALVDVLMPNTAVASGWAIPTVYGPVIAFDEIATYNRAKRLVSPPSTYFTADQTIQEINRIAGTLGYAGLGVLGRTQLSVAPVDPVHPIAVGDNDPRLLSGSNIITPQQFGAIADGSSHPLSSVYGSLAAAQAAFDGAYYFVTSLAQEIDYAAVKAASNACFGADLVIVTPYTTPSNSSTASVIIDLTANYPVNSLVGKVLFFRYPNGFVANNIIASNTATTITLTSPLQFGFAHTGTVGGVCGYSVLAPENIFDCEQYAIGFGEHGITNTRMNKALYFPGGYYQFGNDTWLVRNLVGGHIYGESRVAVTLNSSSWAFQTDGLWYSTIEGISFATTSATPGHGAVDIDGNVPGHPYATRSVQQNTFAWCGFDGGESTYAFALNRQGGSSAQGENIYINCTWQRATVCYFQFGFNALADLILRGDMQDFTTGVYLFAGSVQIIATSFESGRGYAQITDTSFIGHGGYDIDCSASGVGERIVITGVRSESLRFFIGGGAQTGVLIGCNNGLGGANATSWTATTAYTLNQYLATGSVSQGRMLYLVTTTGVSGGTEPVWPNSGTVADGSVVWTQIPFYVVYSAGTVTMIANDLDHTGGSFRSSLVNADYHSLTVTGDFAFAQPTTLPIPQIILVDATSNDVTVTLPHFYGAVFPDGVPLGTQLSIKRVDTTAHIVTINDNSSPFVGPDGLPVTVPALGYLQLEYALGLTLGVPSQQTWRITSSSENYRGSQLAVFTFAQLPTPVADGTMVYVSDGNSGVPLTGGGTGCPAVRVAGVWIGY